MRPHTIIVYINATKSLKRAHYHIRIRLTHD